MSGNSVPLKVKVIHVTNQHMTYRQRHRAFRKTLSFKEKHCNPEYGVIPFAYLSYKMWLTKIWGGFKIVVLKIEEKKK